MPRRNQFKTNEEYNNWFKEYRKRYPQKWRDYRKKWREKNGHDYLRYKVDYPEKYKAHQIVKHAVRIGFLKKKNCKDCGATKVQAHHNNYDKPLIVIWLCQSCHSMRHTK